MRGIVYDGEKTAVVEGLEVRAPGPREVIVEIVAAGLCHSDVSFMSGLYPWPLPAVCGHEGAGIVAQVGDAVTHVKPGDHVIIATLAACGFCEACNDGRPTFCRETLGNATQPFTLDGQPVSNFAAASVFAERTVVRDVQCVPIPDDVPLASAALVGCGVVTGMGAAMNRANVKLGQTAAVFGVGGVGLNVIQGLKVRGAGSWRSTPLPTRSRWPASSAPPTSSSGRATTSSRPSWRSSRSATRSPAGRTTRVAWTGRSTASPHPAVTENALEALDWGGTCVVIGVSGMTTEFHGLYQRLTQVDRGIIGCRYGTISPQRDIPLIIDLYRRGEILLDELVSATYPLAEFEQVVHAMEAGTIARGVLTF